LKSAKSDAIQEFQYPAKKLPLTVGQCNIDYYDSQMIDYCLAEISCGGWEYNYNRLIHRTVGMLQIYRNLTSNDNSRIGENMAMPCPQLDPARSGDQKKPKSRVSDLA
jgi:hypothetical protein